LETGRSHVFFRDISQISLESEENANVKPRPNDRNIVGRNMLRAFGHPVVQCCDMLGVVGSNLTIFKHLNQHFATRRNMVAKRARHVAEQCCDMLRFNEIFLPPHLTFQLNKAVHAVKQTGR